VSLWELGIKRGLDRPDFRVEPSLIRHALLEGGWRELPVEARHIFAVGQLPELHRDPFDRLLLAQAQADGLLLITADQQLAQYPCPVRRMG
jgi:PIN domain nuclease of toxin-antitoxin system